MRLIYTIMLATAAAFALGFAPHGEGERHAGHAHTVCKAYSPFTVEVTASATGNVADVTISVHTTADLQQATLTLITFGDLTVLEAPAPTFSLLAGQTRTFSASVAFADASTLTAEVSADFGAASVVDNSHVDFGTRTASPDFKPAPENRMRVQNVQVK